MVVRDLFMALMVKRCLLMLSPVCLTAVIVHNCRTNQSCFLFKPAKDVSFHIRLSLLLWQYGVDVCKLGSITYVEQVTTEMNLS